MKYRQLAGSQSKKEFPLAAHRSPSSEKEEVTELGIPLAAHRSPSSDSLYSSDTGFSLDSVNQPPPRYGSFSLEEEIEYPRYLDYSFLDQELEFPYNKSDETVSVVESPNDNMENTTPMKK